MPVFDIIDHLRERGQFEAVTDPAFQELALKESYVVYAGFDPTAASLHIGHLVVILGLKRFQMAGHKPIAVAGGGTGLIGDPSGKRSERQLLSRQTIDANTRAIATQLARFLDFSGPHAAEVVNNADWLEQMSFIECLRDVGKHFRLSDMLEKDSVRTRMDSEVGISFTEFSYMLLQSYDFAWLHQNMGCRVQIGGSDQWGNITAGTDLIRKAHQGKAYGVTFPLLMSASGQKFGKSEGGAVWLEGEENEKTKATGHFTTPYNFYQYWMKTEDLDIGKYLRLFTLLPLAEIDGIVATHNAAAHERSGQKRLAFEVTKLVHGEAEAKKAEEASGALFSSKPLEVATSDLGALFPDAPRVELAGALLEGEGIAAAALFAQAGLAASKSEARRLFEQGGAYLNQERLSDPAHAITRANLSKDGSILLRSGKKKFVLVTFKP